LNVSSSQVQDIRKHLSKRAAKLVIGKNTVIKKAISLRMAALDKNHEDYEFFRRFGEPMPQLERLAELV
jgi:ribosomal protein L10